MIDFYTSAFLRNRDRSRMQRTHILHQTHNDTQHKLYINYLSIRKLPSIHCACFHRPNNEIDTEHDTNDHKCDFYMSLANGFVLRPGSGCSFLWAYHVHFLFSEWICFFARFFFPFIPYYLCMSDANFAHILQYHCRWYLIPFILCFFFARFCFFSCLIFKRMDIIALNASQQPINWRRNEIVWSTRVISSALKEFQEPQGNWFSFFSRTLNCTNAIRFFFIDFFFSWQPRRWLDVHASENEKHKQNIVFLYFSFLCILQVYSSIESNSFHLTLFWNSFISISKIESLFSSILFLFLFVNFKTVRSLIIHWLPAAYSLLMFIFI